MKTLAYLLLISMCLTKSLADLKLGHSFFSPLDEDQKVKLYWNISTARREIYFTVEAQTTGWVGFGISSGQGKMKGADIVIGWVKDGKPYFKVKHTRISLVHVCISQFQQCPFPPRANPWAFVFANSPWVGTHKLSKCPGVGTKERRQMPRPWYRRLPTLLQFFLLISE